VSDEHLQDEIDEARRELEALDAEAASEARAATIGEPVDEDGGPPAWLKIGLVLSGLVGVIVFVLLNTDAGDALAYTTPLHEVEAAATDRELRVEGLLKPGSIQFADDPCEWRFTIMSHPPEQGAEEPPPHVEMPVRFHECSVPDTFRDGFGISVTVQGRMDGEAFVANELVPKCPSKYEMQERMENGEEMPHAAPAAMDPSPVEG